MIREGCETMGRENGITTFGGAAAEFGVFRHTIGDLVRAWGIETKRMSNGRAKGLDRNDMEVLRRALNRPARPRKRAPMS